MKTISSHLNQMKKEPRILCICLCIVVMAESQLKLSEERLDFDGHVLEGEESKGSKQLNKK